jgi:hypothetical protein
MKRIVVQGSHGPAGWTEWRLSRLFGFWRATSSRGGRLRGRGTVPAWLAVCVLVAFGLLVEGCASSPDPQPPPPTPDGYDGALVPTGM